MTDENHGMRYENRLVCCHENDMGTPLLCNCFAIVGTG